MRGVLQRARAQTETPNREKVKRLASPESRKKKKFTAHIVHLGDNRTAQLPHLLAEVRDLSRLRAHV